MKTMSSEPKGPTCVRCGCETNIDGSPVTWKCQGCGQRVCRDCTMRNHKDPRVYYDTTVCSQECYDVVRMESGMKGHALDEELE